MIPAVNPNMAIFFADNEYLESFINFISERETGFTCSGFSKVENLRDFADKNDISILLTDKKCFETDAKYIRSEMTVVLTEDPDTETSESITEINILQPVDEILREILKAAAKTDISVVRNTILSTGMIYTFFSPVGRSLKTTLAMTTAQILSEKEKTIYLNLEADSGFTVLLDQYQGTDLSDLMFYLKDGTQNKASLILKSTVCDIQGVSYIPPVMNPQDLYHIESAEFIKLFDLLHGNGFGNIVVDMGQLLPGAEDILNTSYKVFMPVRKDSLSSAKTAQFLSYLRTLEDINLEEKIIKLEPPYFKDIPIPTGNFRGTEISRYMAGIIDGQNE